MYESQPKHQNEKSENEKAMQCGERPPFLLMLSAKQQKLVNIPNVYSFVGKSVWAQFNEKIAIPFVVCCHVSTHIATAANTRTCDTDPILGSVSAVYSQKEWNRLRWYKNGLQTDECGTGVDDVVSIPELSIISDPTLSTVPAQGSVSSKSSMEARQNKTCGQSPRGSTANIPPICNIVGSYLKNEFKRSHWYCCGMRQNGPALHRSPDPPKRLEPLRLALVVVIVVAVAAQTWSFVVARVW